MIAAVASLVLGIKTEVRFSFSFHFSCFGRSPCNLIGLGVWYIVFDIRVFWISVQGIKEGWYDGGSIAFAVILVIVVTGAIRCLLFIAFLNFICLVCHVYGTPFSFLFSYVVLVIWLLVI